MSEFSFPNTHQDAPASSAILFMLEVEPDIIVLPPNSDLPDGAFMHRRLNEYEELEFFAVDASGRDGKDTGEPMWVVSSADSGRFKPGTVRLFDTGKGLETLALATLEQLLAELEENQARNLLISTACPTIIDRLGELRAQRYSATEFCVHLRPESSAVSANFGSSVALRALVAVA